MQSDKEKLERVLEILPEDVLNYIHDSLTSSHELERKAWERLDQLRIHAGKISSKFSNAKIQSGFELMTKNLEVLNVCLNDQLALVNPKASLDHFGVQKHPKTSKDFDTVYKDIYEKSSSFKRSFEDFLETAFSESLDTKKSVKNVTNSVITLTDTGDIYKGASYIMGPSKVSMEYLF